MGPLDKDVVRDDALSSTDDGLALEVHSHWYRALPPERLVYTAVAAPPVVTADVVEIAKDVDEAAVERLAELADEQFVLACARFDISSPGPPRGPYELAVNIDRAHFFDITTGEAIR